MAKIVFENKSFCFTGKMVDMQRSFAEREVRARHGLSQSTINAKLDYLVIGSKPSAGWKFGKYGNKINDARKHIAAGAKTKLIAEGDFIEALANTAPTDSGDIDEKIVLIRYKDLVSNGEFDIHALEDYLKDLQEVQNCHVVGKLEEPYIYANLFEEYSEAEIENLIRFECRIVKHLPLEANSQDFVDAVCMGFEGIKGLDGSVTHSERTEGTAMFSNLMKEIKQNTKL